MKDNLSHSIVSACKGTKKKWNMQNKNYFCRYNLRNA